METTPAAHRFPRTRVLAIAAGAALAVLGGATHGATKTHSFIGDAEGKDIYDKPLMKLMGAELNGKSKYLHVLITACHCGGFAPQADAFLTGKVTVAVPRSTEQPMGYKHLVDKEKYKGELGYRGGASAFYLFGWDAQWAKLLQNTPNSTGQALFDAAKTNEFDQETQGGGFPQLVKKNSGELEPVKVDEGKGEAVIWNNWHSNHFYGLYITLQRRGYYSGAKENTRIDSAHDLGEGSNYGGNNNNAQGAEPPCWVDRKATGPNLKSMIQGLGTRLAADNGNLAGFVYVGGHGNRAKIKDEKFPNAAEGLAAQGRKYTDGEFVTIDLDPEFATDVFEGVSVFTPGAERHIPARVRLFTYEEDFAGPVGVTIDGVSVGSFDLQGASFGDYTVEIPDGALQTIFSQGLFNDLEADIAFHFPQGTPSIDGFRVATEDDEDLGLTEFFGVGLAAPSIIIFSPSCVADLNDDQRTDISDFNIMASNFGLIGVATYEDGDVNSDGNVDILDFNALAGAFGCDVN